METEIKKLSIRTGLKFELTVFFQLKLPEFISMEKNSLLLLEKYKLFWSAIKSDVSREKEDSYTRLLWVGNCQNNSPLFMLIALISPRELLK